MPSQKSEGFGVGEVAFGGCVGGTIAGSVAGGTIAGRCAGGVEGNPAPGIGAGVGVCALISGPGIGAYPPTFGSGMGRGISLGPCPSFCCACVREAHVSGDAGSTGIPGFLKAAALRYMWLFILFNPYLSFQVKTLILD